MKIAIIGAGITGLSAGFYLSSNNHRVVIFEKEKKAGGLAAGFKFGKWLWPLEHYPHHLFTSDAFAISLIKELKLENRLFFRRPKTSIYLRNHLFQFDSPASILKAPLLSFIQKTRIALATSYLKTTNNWQSLKEISARHWLRQTYGAKNHSMLWQPLLTGKFGPEADKVAMSWFWARIKKRSPRLGYLEGGFSVLTGQLQDKIRQRGGQIVLNHKIRNLNEIRSKFDLLIITTSTPVFLKIAPGLPAGYRKGLAKLKIISSLSLVLALKKSFLTDNTYWLNINDRSFPFVFIDEHTNFVDSKYYNYQHLLYVGGYYPQDHPYLKMDRSEVLKKFLPYLKKINPEFDFSLSLTRYWLFTDSYSQPIVTAGYDRLIPNHQTPLKNVYLFNLQQIYPWDRGINYAVGLGKKAAKIPD
ncbi:MAG: FAD-dependent oxidoreductase [Candidatus Pacebacteria bacterium]|nr:FAD-dependent oxidoreductase [Candidatus Paceibacterota bacterium]